MSDDAYKAIYNKALDIVSRREHSQKELSDKLIRKFDIPDVVDSVIYNPLIRFFSSRLYITCLKKILSMIVVIQKLSSLPEKEKALVQRKSCMS